jgi:hypothetical protein
MKFAVLACALGLLVVAGVGCDHYDHSDHHDYRHDRWDDGYRHRGRDHVYYHDDYGRHDHRHWRRDRHRDNHHPDRHW